MGNTKGGLLDKIDWKFFNFLKDKATKFEDLGYNVNISIKSSYYKLNDQGFGDKKDVYFYRYENGEDCTNPILKDEFPRAMKGFISYNIKLKLQGTTLHDELVKKMEVDENITQQYIEAIKSKCSKIIHEEKNTYIVRPHD